MDKQQFDDLKARVAVLEKAAPAGVTTWQPRAPPSDPFALLWTSRTTVEAHAAGLNRKVLCSDGWYCPRVLTVDR